MVTRSRKSKFKVILGLTLFLSLKGSLHICIAIDICLQFANDMLI